MMLLVRPEAQQDILEAVHWYNALQPGKGEDFISEVEAVFKRIAAGPARYTIVYRGLRRALMRRFPYAVYFGEAGPDLIVFAVLHQRRGGQLFHKRLDVELSVGLAGHSAASAAFTISQSRHA